MKQTATVDEILSPQADRSEIGVKLDVPAQQPSHPILRFAGVFKDDPVFDEVQTEIEAYRREVDEDENAP